MSDLAKTLPTVFISHSSTDADLARTLSGLLRAGLKLNPSQIRCTSVGPLTSGDKISDVLKSELLHAQVFIGLITSNSLASSYVLFELGARWGADSQIMLVHAGISLEMLPAPLKDIHSAAAARLDELHNLVSCAHL